MRTQHAPDLDRVRDLLTKGFWVTDVDSTDSHLVLVLGRDGTEHTICLDREETRHLVDENLLAERHEPLLV